MKSFVLPSDCYMFWILWLPSYCESNNLQNHRLHFNFVQHQTSASFYTTEDVYLPQTMTKKKHWHNFSVLMHFVLYFEIVHWFQKHQPLVSFQCFYCCDVLILKAFMYTSLCSQHSLNTCLLSAELKLVHFLFSLSYPVELIVQGMLNIS